MKDRRHSASEAGSFLMGQVNDIDVAKVADNLVPSPARSRAAAHGLRRITGRPAAKKDHGGAAEAGAIGSPPPCPQDTIKILLG